MIRGSPSLVSSTSDSGDNLRFAEAFLGSPYVDILVEVDLAEEPLADAVARGPRVAGGISTYTFIFVCLWEDVFLPF